MILINENVGNEKKYTKIFNRIVLPGAALVGIGASLFVGTNVLPAGSFTSSIWEGLVSTGITATSGLLSSTVIGSVFNSIAKSFAGHTEKTINISNASENEILKFFEVDNLREALRKMPEYLPVEYSDVVGQFVEEGQKESTVNLGLDEKIGKILDISPDDSNQLLSKELLDIIHEIGVNYDERQSQRAAILMATGVHPLFT